METANSRFGPSQWETALLCNDISRWLEANIKSPLHACTKFSRPWALIVVCRLGHNNNLVIANQWLIRNGLEIKCVPGNGNLLKSTCIFIAISLISLDQCLVKVWCSFMYIWIYSDCSIRVPNFKSLYWALFLKMHFHIPKWRSQR